MKETLVFLHGWGGKIESLTPLAKCLEEKGYNIIILEMPGHGSTPQMPKAWGMKEFGEWAKSSIEKQTDNLDNLILIGHSFGGKIILELVSERMLIPKSAILINSNGIKPKPSFKLFVFRNLSVVYKPFRNLFFMKAARSFIYKYIIREHDYLNAREMLKESFKLFNDQHYNDKLDKINIPTLIIWGSEDKVTPLWMGEYLNRNIKNSKLKVVSDTHGLPLKQPLVTANLIEDFLQNG